MKIEEYRYKVISEWVRFRRGLKEGTLEENLKNGIPQNVSLAIGNGYPIESIINVIDKIFFEGYFKKRRIERCLNTTKEELSRIEKEIMFDLNSQSKKIIGYSKKLDGFYEYAISLDLENLIDDEERFKLRVDEMNEKARKLYPTYLKIIKKS